MKNISISLCLFSMSISLIYADTSFTGSYTSPGCEGGMTCYKCESYFLDSENSFPNLGLQTKEGETGIVREEEYLKKEITDDDWAHIEYVRKEAHRAIHQSEQ